jgi:cytochrome c1
VRAIPKSEVEELVKQKISMMPADMQKLMTSQELADVVEYMQSLKKK